MHILVVDCAVCTLPLIMSRAIHYSELEVQRGQPVHISNLISSNEAALPTHPPSTKPYRTNCTSPKNSVEMFPMHSTSQKFNMQCSCYEMHPVYLTPRREAQFIRLIKSPHKTPVSHNVAIWTFLASIKPVDQNFAMMWKRWQKYNIRSKDLRGLWFWSISD